MNEKKITKYLNDTVLAAVERGESVDSKNFIRLLKSHEQENTVKGFVIEMNDGTEFQVSITKI